MKFQIAKYSALAHNYPYTNCPYTRTGYPIRICDAYMA